MWHQKHNNNIIGITNKTNIIIEIKNSVIIYIYIYILITLYFCIKGFHVYDNDILIFWNCTFLSVFGGKIYRECILFINSEISRHRDNPFNMIIDKKEYSYVLVKELPVLYNKHSRSSLTERSTFYLERHHRSLWHVAISSILGEVHTIFSIPVSLLFPKVAFRKSHDGTY